MNPYWMGAITAVAGSVVGLLGGLLVAYANHRWSRDREHERWQREQRQAELSRRIDDVGAQVAACGRIVAASTVLMAVAGSKPQTFMENAARLQLFPSPLETIFDGLAVMPQDECDRATKLFQAVNWLDPQPEEVTQLGQEVLRMQGEFREELQRLRQQRQEVLTNA